MDKKPNIILINCDDFGFGDLGCYGSRKNDSPTVDLIAADGMRFTSNYAPSPVCSPSRAGLMTGCYPPRIGFGDLDEEIVLMPGQDIGLGTNETCIARLLKDVGYSTYMVGKWHCGDQPEFLPTNHGFDDFFGMPYSQDMGRIIGREDTAPLPLLHGKTVIQEQPDLTSITERYTEKCVEYIRGHKDEPFFLYLAHMHCHLPLYCAPMFVKRSRNGDYGACVLAIDWSTNVIVDELKQLGLYEDTIIIFTSDNGSRNDFGESNGIYRGQKGTTWEGGQRVPLIISWPGHIKPGVNDSLVSHIDLYPTIAHLAGAKIPEDRIIDGIDFTDVLLGKAENTKRECFYYYMADKLEAVRVGDYKLFVSRPPEKNINVSENGTLDIYELHPDEPGKMKGRTKIPKDVPVYELYNLREDPGETTNIYDQHPDIVKSLMKYIDACRDDMGDSVTGVKGKNVRPIARVKNAKPLTEFREDHPYIIALYDRDDIG